MRQADRVYWLHALSPMHVGSGRGEGYIDLPLAREKVTELPYVPGSSIKGVLADLHGATVEQRKAKKDLQEAFGLAADDQISSGTAGALVFTDARLVCLPVRSIYGTFAWCTSPLLLSRLRRDLASTGAAASGLPQVPEVNSESSILTADQGVTKLMYEGKVYLEDLDLQAEFVPSTVDWANVLAKWIFPASAQDKESWQGAFQARFAVLHDGVFEFLARTGTEVQPHVRIEDDTKRVARGQLWYEESLPAETVLCGLVWCDSIIRKDQRRHELLKTYASGEQHIQIGGKATVGKGRARCVFTELTS